MKTSKLTGAALDWAVAKCEGLNPDESGLVEIGTFKGRAISVPIFYAPSQNWAQGGPIVQREHINLRFSENNWVAEWWADNSGMAKNPAQRFSPNRFEIGPTPLVAAMRCFVASRLGAEVDVPEELMEV